MKYSEVVGIHSYFQDVFDIMDEKENYWKRFISNEQFEFILDNVLDCLMTSEEQKKKSIWIQGTYGTGKSHSTSVIKHLLSDDLISLEDYLVQINSIQVREKLASFRKENKVFPVVLKGLNAIVDAADLHYTIQNAVNKAIFKTGIEFNTKTDFDLMIEKLSDARLEKFWDEIIGRNQELSMYINCKNDIISELSRGNGKLLRILTNELKAANLVIANSSIESWLTEVLTELKNKGIANYIVIFWDEFTSVLETSERKALLNEIQDIAELSKAGIYVYLVTHKKLEVLESYKELREDEKSMAKARFREMSYDMQPNTTYHIISSAILKKDQEKWNNLKKKYVDENIGVIDVINKLVQNIPMRSLIKEKIKEIYPIHPYTAYLATFVSRNIGSTERSIFKFLNDDIKGFRQYLEKNVEDISFLTADYIWDFFMEDFEQDGINKFDTVVSKYKLYYEQISQKDEIHIAVFKVILLLNILYKMTMTATISDEKNLVIPSVDNIIAAFKGVYSSEQINVVLDYIDNHQIIHRSPDDIFEIAFTSLPVKQVMDEKNREYRKYEDITKLVNQYPVERAVLEKEIKRQIVREVEIKFIWGGENDYSIRNKLSSAFTTSYALSIVVVLFRGDTKNLNEIIGRNERPFTETKHYLLELSKQEEFSNITFLMMKEPIGNKRLEGYVDNIATSVVAKNHGLANDKEEYEKRAIKWVKEWIRAIVDSPDAEIVFRGESVSKPVKLLSNYIDTEIVKIVFNCGLEKAFNLKTESIWKKQNSKVAVESFIFNDTRSELEEKLVGNLSYLKNMIKNSVGDYIIDNKMEFRDNVPAEHPLYIISQKVNEAIKVAQKKSIVNLGDILSFLTKPPYGIYQNIVSMAAISFVLKPYVGRIYKEGTGKLVDKNIMRDLIVSLFNYWQEGKDRDKLAIRFSTDEERRLIEQLKKLFELDTSEGLVNTKWTIRDKFVKNHNSPLWTLKYCGNENEGFKKALDCLFKFTKTIDGEIQQSDICELLELISENYIDLSHALISSDKDHGLKCYILQIKDANIKQEEIPELMAYMEKTLQENKAFWEESEVEQITWKWLAIRNSKSNSSQNDNSKSTNWNTTDNFYEGVYGGSFNGSKVEDRQTSDESDEKTLQNYKGNEGANNNKTATKSAENVKNRIRDFNGTIDEFKEIITRIIDENPTLAEVFERFFG